MEKKWNSTSAQIAFKNEDDDKIKSVNFSNLIEETTGDQINALAVNVANLSDELYLHTIVTTREIVKSEI